MRDNVSLTNNNLRNKHSLMPVSIQPTVIICVDINIFSYTWSIHVFILGWTKLTGPPSNTQNISKNEVVACILSF